MTIVLFAIIGALIEAGVGYWICFAVFCVIKLGQAIYKTLEEKDLL